MIGQAKTIVEVKREVVARDGIGGLVKTWETVMYAWAKVEEVIKSYDNPPEVGYRREVIITTREIPGLSPTWRIAIKGVDFVIKAIRTLEGGWVEVEAEQHGEG